MDIQANSSFHRLLYHTSERSSGPMMGQGVGKFILTPIQTHKLLLKNSSNIIDSSLDLSFCLFLSLYITIFFKTFIFNEFEFYNSMNYMNLYSSMLIHLCSIH